ncbi:uncharacterized protein LOC120351302 isoform X2 [Nilaparvata lugens]|uniref:uncharacterized protein LOC120351302 isoform X2 n=1 Tax=Nilaparvata lugens TaxID=108931 RepID=UPI00193CF140|nr:uncharacterized protein LOC120351302 isoform X2 [Nilaparvata lugens]
MDENDETIESDSADGLPDIVPEKSKPQMDAEIIICHLCNKPYGNVSLFHAHLKNVHKVNARGERVASYPCKECSWIFKTLSSLRRHTANKHPKQDQPRFNCGHCTYNTTVLYYLKRHILKHENDEAKLFPCAYCEARYDNVESLNRHIKSKRHERRKNINYNKKCPKCDFVSTKKLTDEIHDHFRKVHHIPISWQSFTFSCEDDFLDWKQNLEMSTSMQYRTNYNTAMYYVCNLSHNYVKNRQNGNKFSGGYCPSAIGVRVKENGQYCVSYMPCHVGHYEVYECVTSSIDCRKSDDCRSNDDQLDRGKLDDFRSTDGLDRGKLDDCRSNDDQLDRRKLDDFRSTDELDRRMSDDCDVAEAVRHIQTNDEADRHLLTGENDSNYSREAGGNSDSEMEDDEDSVLVVGADSALINSIIGVNSSDDIAGKSKGSYNDWVEKMRCDSDLLNIRKTLNLKEPEVNVAKMRSDVGNIINAVNFDSKTGEPDETDTNFRSDNDVGNTGKNVIIDATKNSVSNYRYWMEKLRSDPDMQSIRNTLIIRVDEPKGNDQNLEGDVVRNDETVRVDRKESNKDWVRKLKNDANTSLFYFKPLKVVSRQFPKLKMDDCVLIYMSGTQKSILEACGRNVICVDKGCLVNDEKNLKLFVISVIDSCRRVVPVAFMFTNSCDFSLVMSIFFRKVEEHCGCLTPRLFMSDIEGSVYSTWCEIMGTPKMQIFPTANVSEAWENNLSKINVLEKREYVSGALKSLLYETDKETFHKLLEEFLGYLVNDVSCLGYLEYFQDNFVENMCYKNWAHCYIDNFCFDEPLERFRQNFLQACCGEVKPLKSFHEIFSVFFNFSQRKISEWYVEIEKRNSIRQRHKKSLLIPSAILVKIGGDNWEIMSETGKTFYSVKKADNCNVKCKSLCTRCKSCLHEFVCTCEDYVSGKNMCIHVHLVARSLLGSKRGTVREETFFDTQATRDRRVVSQDKKRSKSDSSRYKSRNDTLASRNDTLVSRNDTLVSRNDTLASRNDTLVSRNDTLASRNDTLVSRNDTLVSRNDTLASRNDTLVSRNDTLVSRNDTLASRNDTLVSRNDTLVSQNDTQLVVSEEIIENVVNFEQLVQEIDPNEVTVVLEEVRFRDKLQKFVDYCQDGLKSRKQIAYLEKVMEQAMCHSDSIH